MSTVLGSFAPDVAKGSRERQNVAETPQALNLKALASNNVALPEGLGPVYDEEVFRYFLQVERKRANRSNSRFLLLLVDLKRDAQNSAHFDASSSTKLFSAMWPCLRETDFIGWYRQGRVASAVLTQVGEAHGVEVSSLVAHRVREALTPGLSSTLATRLQVRIYQVPATEVTEVGS